MEKLNIRSLNSFAALPKICSPTSQHISYQNSRVGSADSHPDKKRNKFATGIITPIQSSSAMKNAKSSFCSAKAKQEPTMTIPIMVEHNENYNSASILTTSAMTPQPTTQMTTPNQ